MTILHPQKRIMTEQLHEYVNELESLYQELAMLESTGDKYDSDTLLITSRVSEIMHNFHEYMGQSFVNVIRAKKN